MDHGWIKIHRSILEWEWFDDANTFRVFFYCLIRANHKTNTWHRIVISRGTFITSYSNMAKDLKLSFQQVRTALDKLILTQEITRRATNKYTIITVCNYDTYQISKNDEQQTKQHSNNNQITTNNNDKNEIIKEKTYSATIQEIVAKFYSIKKLKHKNAIKVTGSLLEKSCEVIDKLNRIDEVPLDYIEEVITRSITDDFWKDQIMSLSGLRKKTNGVMKFINLANAVTKSGYIPEKTKKLIAHLYECPSCNKRYQPREKIEKDSAFAHRCTEPGCQKVGLGRDGKNMVGYELRYIHAIYKDIS